MEENLSNAPLLTNKGYTSIIAEPLEPQKADAAASKMWGVKLTRSLPTMPLVILDAQIRMSEARYHKSDHGIKLLPRLPRSVFNIANEWWIWEVTGWTVSLLVIIALLATLLKYNGRALPDWPLQITLNSVIALCATVFKAMILVPVVEGISQLKWCLFQRTQALQEMEINDNASRGPWGSTRFLFSPRVRYDFAHLDGKCRLTWPTGT